MAQDRPSINESRDNSEDSGEIKGSAIVSKGESPTRADDALGQYLAPNQELPPELLSELQAVLLQKGDTVADRFEVVALLGFGGMGAVYRVTDRHLGGDKALKVMLPSLLRSDAARQRFRDEVSICQRLAHEGIVRVHDLGVDHRRKFYFFTMEFVEGKTLHRLLVDRGGKLTVEEALNLTRQLCDALEYAHRYTIHRDLKPQNVMVEPNGHVKLLDFGLAKVMSPGRLTKSSMALGTAYYQAPEQSIQLTELDQRADVYSLGVMLYQMLTGRIPLGMSKAPSKLVPGIPKYLDTVVSTCLQPEAVDRYQNIASLRGALQGESARKVYRTRIVVTGFLSLTAVMGFWVYKLASLEENRLPESEVNTPIVPSHTRQ